MTSAHNRLVAWIVVLVTLVAVAAVCLYDGPGASADPELAREIIGQDASRMTGHGKALVEEYDAAHR